MENCLNKAELLEKFNLCYDSLNKILDYLKLPFEIKTSANYKKVAYPNDNQSKLDAKTKCMKEHNVKIISKKEIKPFIYYFKKNCTIPIIDNRTKKINTKLC